MSPAAPAGPRRVVLAHDANEFGGMELYMLTLMDHLDRARYEPILLVPGYRDDARSSPASLVDRAEAAGVEVLRPDDPGDVRGIASARELAGLVGALRRSRADLVHIHTCRPDGARKVTVAAELARVGGLVRSEHMPPAVYMSERSRFLVKPFDRMTDVIVAGSDGDRRDQIELLGRSPRRLTRIHNGIDVSAFGPAADAAVAKTDLGLDPSVPTVGTVGRLVEQKGQRHLLDATRRVIDQIGPINLLIVGDGELRHELETQAERLAIREHVHFLGHLDDIAPVLDATDVAAMPSLWEVLSLSMLEFMAAGKPIVASTHSSFQEAIVDGESGMLIPPDETDRWATAIVGLLNSPADRRRLGTAAQARVRQHFSFERLVEQMMALYDRVLDRG